MRRHAGLDPVTDPAVRPRRGGLWSLVGLSTGLRRFWGISVDTTSLIILTMIASAWDGGRGPGLLVALLFEATLDYYAGFPRVAGRFYVVMLNRIVLFTSLVLFASARRAVKFTPGGGRIHVRLTREGAGVRLQVADTGAGISPAFLPHVFDPFRQADSSMTRPHGGLGLGLAIVRHLVELHGGTISVENASADGGAVFTLRLPVAGPVPDQKQGAATMS